MKKKCIFTIIALLITMIVITGCSAKSEGDGLTAVCSNGQFIGAAEEETGVLAWKGIPYAQPPVGDLRWKAPVAASDSDEVVEAKEFGKSSIQYEWHSEPITTERSEDCLTLNVWTKDLSKKDKPVMVYFHGGSFAWGGTSEEIYNGQYIVNENEDVVVVTCNYRLGMMGFIDFSSVEGGDQFTDSRELGLLDAIEALRWVKKNVSAFGGDSENITIFGESAGSTMIMCLLACDETEGLFNKAICQSGSLNLTYSDDNFKDSYQAEALLLATGAKNMDELMALSEADLIEANELSLDEDEMTVNDYYSLPYRGGIVPENVYEGIAKAKARGVDVIIGTNTDEIAYWVAEMGEEPMVGMDEDGVAENLEVYEEYFVDVQYDGIMDMLDKSEKARVKEYMEMNSDLDQVWARTKFLTEAMFRQPSIKAADALADAEGEGKVYMYYFGKRSDNFDFVGACHASELAYVFHNLKETDFSGTVDETLADNMCAAWVNFARTGDPSTEAAQWTTFDTENRNTMVIGDDCSMTMVSDPDGDVRQTLDFLAEHLIWAAGA